MNIRKMEYTDLKMEKKSLVSLFKDTYKENFPEGMDFYRMAQQKYSELMEYYRNGSAILIGAFSDKGLVGILWAYKRMALEGERIHLTQLCVRKEFRKRGIGSRLIVYLEKVSEEMKIKTIELMATYENKKVMEFYLKNDFGIERVLLKKEIENNRL